MTSIKAPCILSKNVAFIDPGNAAKRSLDAATEMCHQCPMLQACALDALHGGNSLDGNMTRPATDVLQAGFHCRGDARTARKLAAIAGVPTPPEYRDQAPRNFAPDQCVNCKKPMHKWTRFPEEIPAGHVMAYARGHCVNCRSAYRAMLDTERGTPKLRKPANRRKIYTHCGHCERPLKMQGEPLEPGYYRHGARGLCLMCLKSRRRAKRGSQPAVSSWVTVDAAAKQYTSPRWKLRLLVAQGRVDSRRDAGRVMVSTNDLDAVLAGADKGF